MTPEPDNPPADSSKLLRLPEACCESVRERFNRSSAGRWKLSFAALEPALVRSAVKRFAGVTPSDSQLTEYFQGLHLEDLVLACACAEGSEAAWEDFIATYRPHLRAASSAILRRPVSDPGVIELADSLFSDLYGISARQDARRSLFRYFHGRSSLKTWLRAVLAQRHIDQIRAGKKLESFDEPADGETRRAPEPAVTPPPADPSREHYLHLFRRALTFALAALDSRDRTRLQLYYAQDRTLAEIGRAIGEHESSVSRNLERVRKDLRATVEGLLRAGTPAANGAASSAGLDGAQIALCIQYAAEDASIDLEKLFDASKSSNAAGRNRAVKP